MPRRVSAARRVVLGGLLGALLVVCKEVLAPVPGVEPVTPLILFYAMELPALGPWAVTVFVVLQFLLYGFGLWSFVARALHRMDSAVGWALVAGSFGLGFGALFTPIYWLTQGPGGALAWWLAGIPTDVAHCIANFGVMLVLYRPLRPVFRRLAAKSQNP